MEEYKMGLLMKLVSRYNFLQQRAFNATEDDYRDALSLRAMEVLFIVDELFGRGAVVVRAKELSRMTIRKD